MIKGYSKVTLLSGGGLTTTKNVKVEEGGVTNIKEVTTKDPGNPHPDLTGKFEDLKGHLLKALGLDPLSSLLEFGSMPAAKTTAKVKAAVKDLKTTIGRLQTEMESKLEVTQISISGTEEKPKVIVTGTKECPNGAKSALNSPLISLEGSRFGFEEDLQKDLEALIAEVEKYENEGKRSQLSMDFGEGKEKKDEKKLEVA